MATEIWELTESDEGTIYFEGVSDKYAAELRAAETTNDHPQEDGWFCFELTSSDPAENRAQLIDEARKLGFDTNDIVNRLEG